MSQQIIIPASPNQTQLEISNDQAQTYFSKIFPPSASDSILNVVVTEITTTTTTTIPPTTTTTTLPPTTTTTTTIPPTTTTTTTLPPTTTTTTTKSPDVTLFGNSPLTLTKLNDKEALEIGVRFQSSKAGFIKGIRFWKAAGGTGVHTATLWANSTTKLATATFTESASGWQQVLFTTPIAISANVVYIASVYSPSGDYVSKNNGLATVVTSTPLSTATGSNGVFKYGTSGFPSSTYQASNYYVDVIFSADSSASTTTTTTAQSITTTTTPSPSTTTTTTQASTGGIKLEGFGALAGGANTNKVYRVTNLNSTGQGSLNYILSETNPTGYTIVFDVAGTIKQSHRVYTGDHFTIDGTTAPYPGVTIATGGGDGLVMEGSAVHNIIVKGLTAINCSNDGIAVNDGAHDIMITNCTSYGNGDGNIDVSGGDSGVSNHVTVQYCIIGNNKARVNGNSGGTLITGSYVSWHHNLAYPAPPNMNEDGERFPYVHCNYSPVATPNADVRNNFIWNWGRDNSTGSGFGTNVVYGAKANVVNNYLKTIGPSIDAGITVNGYGEPTGYAFISGNVSGNNYDYNKKSNLAEIAIPAQYQVTLEDTCSAVTSVLQKAGITQRDAQGNRRADEQVYTNITGITNC